jgi:Flp pilus assembly protein TadD
MARSSERMTVGCPACRKQFDVGAAESGVAICPYCGKEVDLDPAHDLPPNPFGDTTGQARDASAPWIGQTVGGCRLDKKLGQGGMGMVYRATHLTLNKDVAVKLLPDDTAGSREFVERFLREARLAGQLEHRNIVQVYNVGEEAACHFIVMQYIDGGSVGSLLKRRFPMSAKFATKVVEQVAIGLAAAHRKNVIHRDIKPDNIMVSKAGDVKIADFGLAKSQVVDGSLTMAGQVMGSPAFMSPEQCDGKDVDHQTDIYSLGITYYYMVCGRKPFVAESPVQVMMLHKSEPPVPPVLVDASIPRGVSDVIMKMIAKKKPERYQTADEVVEALADVLQKLSDTDVTRTTSGKRFGEIAMRVANVTRTDIDAAINEQSRLRRDGKAVPSVGELLYEIGKLDGDQIKRILAEQNGQPAPAAAAARTQRGGKRPAAAVGNDTTPVALEGADASIQRELGKITEEAMRALDGESAEHAPGLLDGFISQHAGTKWEREGRAAAQSVRERLVKRLDRNGQLAIEKADFKTAIVQLSKAVEIDPSNASAHSSRGVALMRKGDLALALQSLDRACELSPDNAAPFYNRGNVHRKAGNLDKAIDDYSRAIQLDSGHARAMCNRGGIYFTKKEFEKAIAEFNAALNVDSSNIEALTGRGRALERLDRIDQAVNDYERACQVNPRDARGFSHLGALYLKVNRPDDARKALQQAVRLDQAFPDTFFHLACLSVLDRDDDKAMQLLKKAVKKGYTRPRRFATEAMLQPLRERPDFKKLVESLKT